ncbi:MAG: aromatic ring-hydroxylating dioxygenase subunit alpha [Nitrososphaerota archaeon]|nr:aromatic ring-hydroxylating dioxygenase subunit alpha [Nitrososphaerota archaeon]MDG7024034.1 aromatic ring-hydroxylating dioxygenase subunit alpha [Nitrososphaerota archaeon]
MIEDPVLLSDWHPVLRSSDLPEASVRSVKLLGVDLVVWRIHGEPKVWQDLCVHRGTRLSLGHIEGGAMKCAYHGWTYNGEGECVRIPAHPDQRPPSRARVKTYRCTERYGLVWACLGEPAKDVPPFDEWDNPDYRKIFCGPYAYRASPTRAIENFLDVAHFPFVHGGLLGDEAHAEIMDYDVSSGPEGVVARNVKVWQPDPDGTGRGKSVDYTYWVLRPLTARFSKATDEGTFAIQLNVAPVDELDCTAWMCIALDYARDTSDDELRSFQDRITRQDIPVVESQRPELLPLDLQAELHLRSDRIAVCYRKWLKQLGLTFGTA